MHDQKYESLADLAEAFASGGMSTSEWELIVEDDASYLHWTGEVPEDADDAWHDEKMAEGDSLYEGRGEMDYTEALDALEIPWRWA